MGLILITGKLTTVEESCHRDGLVVAGERDAPSCFGRQGSQVIDLVAARTDSGRVAGEAVVGTGLTYSGGVNREKSGRTAQVVTSTALQEVVLLAVGAHRQRVATHAPDRTLGSRSHVALVIASVRLAPLGLSVEAAVVEGGAAGA